MLVRATIAWPSGASVFPKPRLFPVCKSGKLAFQPPSERSVSSAAYRVRYACIDLPLPRAQLPWPVAFSDAPARRFNCATLTFKLLAKEGPTGSGQSPGEANIKRVEVQLPKLLPARLTTLQKSCTQAQFSANPAGCPEFSFVGTAIRIDLVGNISITKGLSTSVRNRFRMPPTETSN